MDWERLADYATRFKSQALIQRLGYLADILELSLDTSTRGILLAHVGKSTCYLGQPSQWKKGGEYDTTWHIVDNIPRRELLADTEVH